MEPIFKKENINKKVLSILVSVISFLVFAYFAGNIKWITDMQKFIDLISSVFAFFIGTLALVRYYTKKNSINYLFLGLGFVLVGIIEVLQILASLGSFSDLFYVGYSEIFPTTIVISRIFLSITMFLSWVLSREENRERNINDKIAYVATIFVLTVTIIIISLYTKIFINYEEYIFAIIGQTIAMLIYFVSLLGYLKTKGIYIRSFDFWLIFSIVFGLISQIFFLPYLNLEYQLMLNLATLAKFFSYLILLVGFLNSVYEMFKQEEDIKKELERSNLMLKETKKKVEEAYMILRSEKWELTKEKEKNTADGILKDILNSNK